MPRPPPVSGTSATRLQIRFTFLKRSFRPASDWIPITAVCGRESSTLRIKGSPWDDSRTAVISVENE